jgi:hypothetical protein
MEICLGFRVQCVQSTVQSESVVAGTGFGDSAMLTECRWSLVVQ